MNQILSAKTSNSCKVLSDENISKLSTSPKICNNISDSTPTAATASTSAHAAAIATPTSAATTSANNISRTNNSHTNNNYVHPQPSTHRQQLYHQVAPRKRKFDQPQQQPLPAGASSSVLVDSLVKTTATATSNCNNTNSNNTTASLSASAKTAPCSTAPSTSANSSSSSLLSPAAKRSVASHPPAPSSSSTAPVTPPAAAAASTLTESTDVNGDTLTVVKSERPTAAVNTEGKIADSARRADPTTNPPTSESSQHCDSSSGSGSKKAPSEEPHLSTTSPPPPSSTASRENHQPLRVSVTLSKVAARKLRQLAANNPRILRKLGIKTLKLVSSDGSAGEPIHLPQRPPPSPVPVPLAAQLSALSRSGSANGEHPSHPHHPANNNGVLVSPLHFAQQQLRGAAGLSKIITSATPQQQQAQSAMEQHHGAAASVAAQQHQHMLQQQQQQYQQQHFQQHQQRLAGGGMAPSPMYGAMQTPTMPGQPPAMAATGPQQQQQMQAVMRQNSAIVAQQQRMMATAGGSNGSVPGTPLSATPIPAQQQQRRSIDTPGTPQQMQMQMNAVQRQSAFQAGASMGMVPQHGGMMVDQQQQSAGQAPHGHHSQPGTSQNMADAPLLVNLLSNNNGPQHQAGMMPGQPPMMTPEQQHAAAMQQRYGGHGPPPGMTPGQQQQLYLQQQHMLAQSGGPGGPTPMGGMMSQQQYMQHQQQMMLHQQQMQQRAAADGAAGGAGGMMMMAGGQSMTGVMPGMVPPAQFAPQPSGMPPSANASLQQQPPQTADNAENPPPKKRKRQSKKAQQKEEELRLQQQQQQQQLHQQQLQQQKQQFAMQQMQQQVGVTNPQEYYIMQHHQQQPRVPAMGMHVVGPASQIPGQQYQQRMPGYPVQYNGYGSQPQPQGQPPNTSSTPGAMNPMMNPHFPGGYNAPPGMHAGHPQAQLWQQQQQSAAAAAAAQQQADFQQQQQQMRMTPQHHHPPQVGTPCNFYVHPSSSQSPMDMKSQQPQIPPPPSYGESNAAVAAVNQRGTPHNMGFMSPSHQHSASPVFPAGGGQQPPGGHGQPSRASTGSIGSNMGTPSTPQQSAGGGNGQLSQQQIFSQLTDYADLGDDLNAITGDAEDFDLDSIEPMRTDNSGSNSSPAQPSQQPQQQQQPNGQSSAAQSHQRQQQHQQMIMQQQMGQQVGFPPEYAGSPAQQHQQQQFMHQQQQQHMQMMRQQQQHQNVMTQQQQRQQQQMSVQQSVESAVGLGQPAPPPQKRQRQGGGPKSGANGGSTAGQPPKSVVKRESADGAPSNDDNAGGIAVKEEEEDLESKFFAQRSPQNSDEPSSPSKISELQQENITNSIQSVMERVLGNNGNGSSGAGIAGSASVQPAKGAGSQKGRSKGGGPKADKKLANGESGGGGRTSKRPHSIVLPRTASTSDASSLSASPGTAPPSASILSAQPSRSRTPIFAAATAGGAYTGFNGHAGNGGSEHSPKTAGGSPAATPMAGAGSEKTIDSLLKSVGNKQQPIAVSDAKSGVGGAKNKLPSWQRAVGPMESPPATSSSSAVVTPGSGGVAGGSTGMVSIFSSSCSSSSASSMSSTLTDHYANFNGHSETFTTELETTSISSISYKATSKTIAISATKASVDASPNSPDSVVDNGAVDERPPAKDKPAASDFDAAAERSPPNAAAVDGSSPPSTGAAKENGQGESTEILQASKA